MHQLVIFASLVVLSFAQRPSYAGSRPIGRPELAARFRGDEETTTVNLNNRLGGTGTTQRIPIDARGDSKLVDTLEKWPREHRPFWLLNADHIERSRNTTRNQSASLINNRVQAQSSQQNFGNRGDLNDFLGNSNRIQTGNSFETGFNQDGLYVSNEFDSNQNRDGNGRDFRSGNTFNEFNRQNEVNGFRAGNAHFRPRPISKRQNQLLN